MAGESNYGGNGSVYWKTRHLDEFGRPVAIKKKGNPKCADPVDEEKDHWIDIGDPYQLLAHDPIRHPTFFTLAMRFDTSPHGRRDTDGHPPRAEGVATTEGLATTERHEAHDRDGIEALADKGHAVLDFAVRAARKVIIEAELIKLIKSAEEALRRIKAGEGEAVVEASVPIVRRFEIPSEEFEVTVRW